MEKEDLEEICDALEDCLDVTISDVVYMIYKRQEELEQEPHDY